VLSPFLFGMVFVEFVVVGTVRRRVVVKHRTGRLVFVVLMDTPGAVEEIPNNIVGMSNLNLLLREHSLEEFFQKSVRTQGTLCVLTQLTFRVLTRLTFRVLIQLTFHKFLDDHHVEIDISVYQ